MSGWTINQSVGEFQVVYLGLGANIGDPVGQLRKAVGEMIGRDLLVSPVRKSSLYRTPPWDQSGDQPWFVNAVVAGKTARSPYELLAAIKRIECDLGRSAEQSHGRPRIIDIDILLYGGMVMRSADLTIPHPRLHERPFALIPLLELEPSLTDPISGLPYVQHLERIARKAARIEKLRETL